MHGAHLLPANALSILEGISQDTLRGFTGDELDALDDTVNNHVLDARVLPLGVFTNEYSVDVVIWSLITFNRLAGSNVGEEVEGSSEGQIERDMAFSNRSLLLSESSIAGVCLAYGERALQRNIVLLDARNGCVRDDRLAVLELGGHVDRFPFDWYLPISVCIVAANSQRRLHTLAAE